MFQDSTNKTKGNNNDYILLIMHEILYEIKYELFWIQSILPHGPTTLKIL